MVPYVPDHEVQVDFARSSGPGGQNVNKRETKVVARWNVGASVVFTDEQKTRIRTAAANRLNADDEIVVAVEEERSQPQNRAVALERLRRIVAAALTPRKLRRKTKPTAASRRVRLESKRIQSEKKARRRPPKNGW